ncbi:phosphopantetheine-binding protein [Kitasatospora sp. NPDC127067]|uniref:phosphopantetheine-binding protein n=1 Tax=Kitasatospora sp. NPDC127067 TaxID=3347126 RepID=UPI003650114B
MNQESATASPSSPASAPPRLEPMIALVKEHAAAISDLPVEEIDDDQLFQELGFDSLMTVRLVNGLEKATGLEFELGVVGENPTPADLAAFLCASLARQDQEAPSTAPPAADGIGDIFRRTVEEGRAVEALDFLAAAARLRPRYSGAEDAGPPPPPARLSRGPESRKIICLDSLGPFLGNFTYSRFAKRFLGLHDVHALRYPGYARPDAVPESPAALGRAMAPTVERCADGAPFVLVGYCSGGWASLLVAAELESRGAGPEAVLLIDTPVPEDLSDEVFNGGTKSLLESWPDIVSLETPALTAFGWHYSMLRGHPLPGTAAPTYSIRATEPLPYTDGVRLNNHWPDSVESADVAADHYSVMVAHAAEAADIAARWI